MFSFRLETPELIRVLKALQERIGLFPFEINENGIEIATMDDGGNMVIWIYFPLEMMKDFEFEGDGVERYIIPSKTFTEAVGSTSYPLEIGSLMDGSLKINSADGRRTYKIIPETDANPEDSDYHRNRFGGIVAEEEYVKIRILKQDLLEAVRAVKIASEQIKIVLEPNALVLSTVDAIIEADAVAPLVASVENTNWTHSYNVKLLEYFLSILKENLEVEMYLLTNTDTFMVNIPISENGFCKMAIAAIPERGED